MKYSVFLLPILFMFSVTGCKKNKAIEPDCYVIVIVPSSGAPVNFSYNSEGEIESIKEGLNSISFIYKTDSIIASQTRNNIFYEKRKYKLNSNGFPSNVRIESDQSGNNWINYSYEYNGTELKKMTITTSSAGLSQVYNYTWNNGNLTSITDGTNTHTYEYYSDKTYRVGDACFLMERLHDYGVGVMRTKNMRKSDQYVSPAGSYTLNYNYEFDSKGKVTAVKENSLTYNLQYQCN